MDRQLYETRYGDLTGFCRRHKRVVVEADGCPDCVEEEQEEEQEEDGEQ